MGTAVMEDTNEHNGDGGEIGTLKHALYAFTGTNTQRLVGQSESPYGLSQNVG